METCSLYKLTSLQVTLLRQNLGTPRRQQTSAATGQQGSSSAGSASPAHSSQGPSTSTILDDVLGTLFPLLIFASLESLKLT